jgi:hypothetical protein
MKLGEQLADMLENLLERQTDGFGAGTIHPVVERLSQRSCQRLLVFGMTQRPVEGRLYMSDESP